MDTRGRREVYRTSISDCRAGRTCQRHFNQLRARYDIRAEWVQVNSKEWNTRAGLHVQEEQERNFVHTGAHRVPKVADSSGPTATTPPILEQQKEVKLNEATPTTAKNVELGARICGNMQQPGRYTFLSFEERIRQKISSYMNIAKCIEQWYIVGLNGVLIGRCIRCSVVDWS